MEGIDFISHMVQMKDISEPSRNARRCLFISHMVQMKASQRCLLRCLNPSFISHMVQMKVHFMFLKAQGLTPLYPTWFRWKTFPIYAKSPRHKSLYPTWFRWKDERAFGVEHSRLYFISHMVQMKVLLPVEELFVTSTFISHMVQMKERRIEEAQKERTILYIPHGSDERG